MQRFCTQCGERLNPNHKFCGQCGAEVQGHAPAARGTIWEAIRGYHTSEGVDIVAVRPLAPESSSLDSLLWVYSESDTFDNITGDDTVPCDLCSAPLRGAGDAWNVDNGSDVVYTLCDACVCAYLDARQSWIGRVTADMVAADPQVLAGCATLFTGNNDLCSEITRVERVAAGASLKCWKCTEPIRSGQSVCWIDGLDRPVEVGCLDLVRTVRPH